MKKILSLFLLISLFSFKHPFYLGVTDLKYNAREKALQGAVKLFTNDLEDALKKVHGRTIDLINPKDTAETARILRAYLDKHLAFTINNQVRTFEFVGFEQEQEAVWMYLEIKNCPLPKKISVQNSLLYEHLKDQSNIIHLEVNEVKKSLKLNNPDKLAVFEF